MIRVTSSLSASKCVCTTARIAPWPIAPKVIQRSSSSDDSSRSVRAYGSSNTRVAVSKRTSCFSRFCRFFASSIQNASQLSADRFRIRGKPVECKYKCMYTLSTERSPSAVPPPTPAADSAAPRPPRRCPYAAPGPHPARRAENDSRAASRPWPKRGHISPDRRPRG